MSTTQLERSSSSELFSYSATAIGRSSPLGATVRHGGVNFSLYSSTATDVELLLFDAVGDGTPSCVIRLDPADNRSYSQQRFEPVLSKLMFPC